MSESRSAACEQELKEVRIAYALASAERDRYREALKRIGASFGSGASPYRLARQALEKS